MAMKILDPTLMILTEKWGSSYYLLHNVTDYINVLTKIAQERIAAGHFYETTSDEQTDLFVDNLSQHETIVALLLMDRTEPTFKSGIHHFMQDRMLSGYKYEGWELEQFATMPEMVVNIKPV